MFDGNDVSAKRAIVEAHAVRIVTLLTHALLRIPTEKKIDVVAPFKAFDRKNQKRWL
jgi:hypothetical protein